LAMPAVCLVRECSTRYGKMNDIRLHKLPDDPQRRAAWLRAIDWEPRCSELAPSSLLVSPSD
ncbi:hypothetical protein HPB47_024688, partial [Ixodes persulcatus]